MGEGLYREENHIQIMFYHRATESMEKRLML